MKHTAHFVVYLKKDGTMQGGELCKSPDCAVSSVNFDEGAKLLGPFSIEIDDECTRYDNRSEMLKTLNLAPDISRLFGNTFHPVVEPK